MKFLLNYERPRNLMPYFFNDATLERNKTQPRKRRKVCIFSFSNKGDLRITKNYSGIILTAIVTKLYNALLLNHILPEVEKILLKNQNEFQRNRAILSQILAFLRIIDGVCARNLEVKLLFIHFSKASDSIHRGKMEQILLACSLPKEAVSTIMMLYKNLKAMVCSPNSDTNF